MIMRRILAGVFSLILLAVPTVHGEEGVRIAFLDSGISQRSGVDVLAPGVNLPTVTNRNAAKTERKSGTSYACAYISGVCGQILTENPTMTAAELQSALFDMAWDIGEVGYDADSGWGVVKTVTLTDRATMRFWGLALQENLAQTLKNARQ